LDCGGSPTVKVGSTLVKAATPSSQEVTCTIQTLARVEMLRLGNGVAETYNRWKNDVLLVRKPLYKAYHFVGECFDG
jgi:hypothetical protein